MSEYDYLFKILIIGESCVGKSCILLRFTENIFIDHYITTIGVDFKIRTVEVEGKKIKLQVWDTAGQERFKSITRSYYQGSDGILFVYDLTNKDSYIKAREWIENTKSEGLCEHAVKILVGNKNDLEDKREVSQAEGESLAKEFDIPFIETSAKDANNIETVFQIMTEAILNNVRKLDKTNKEPEKVESFKGKSIGKEGKCC